MANYMPINFRSAKLLHRLGFTVEGYAKNYLLINNRWEDHVLTALSVVANGIGNQNVHFLQTKSQKKL